MLVLSVRFVTYVIFVIGLYFGSFCATLFSLNNVLLWRANCATGAKQQFPGFGAAPKKLRVKWFYRGKL